MKKRYKHGNRIIRPGRAWRSDDGTKHPQNWYSRWTKEEIKAAGLKEVKDE